MQQTTPFFKLYQNKSLYIFNKLKNCSGKDEKEISDVYNDVFKFYFNNINIQYPYKCDCHIELTTGSGSNLSLICEYKLNNDLTNSLSRSKILIQVIFYLKQFELNGKTIPNVIFIGTQTECFVIHSNKLLKYLDYDVDWKTAPSSAYKQYPNFVEDISVDENINPFIYSINESFDFKDVITKIHEECENIKRLIRITEHNISRIFEYFTDRILINQKQLTPNQIVSCFVGLLTNDNLYYLHPKKKNTIVTPQGNIAANSQSIVSFFNQYARDYTPQEKMKFTEISDRLIEETARRKQGAFFTPVKFVDFAHKMIENELGENWKEEYVVYDCCCGCMNLTRDYKFKELYCSTLLQEELSLSERYNPEAKKWQMDFLNDDDNKLNPDLIKALEQNKPIIFFINPPYGTGNNSKYSNVKKTNVTKTKQSMIMKNNKIGLSNNLQTQFMYRITTLAKRYNLSNCYFALFSNPSWISNLNSTKFLNFFFNNWIVKDAYLFNASNFENVTKNWGISLTLFKLENNENSQTNIKFKLINVDEFNNINIFGEHFIKNEEKTIFKWILLDDKNEIKQQEPVATSGLKLDSQKRKVLGYKNKLGYLIRDASCCLATIQYPNRGYLINKQNILNALSCFTVNNVLKTEWFTHEDVIKQPNISLFDISNFKYDAIIYSLFNSNSMQSSLRNVDYLGEKYNVKNEFFWMSKEQMKELANENHDDFMFNDARTETNDRYIYKLLFEENYFDKLSDTAKQVINKATELVVKSMKYRTMFESDHPDYHIHTWDAGYYQLKNLWKEYSPDEFTEFRTLYKKLGNELEPLIYDLGFVEKPIIYDT